MPDFRIASSFKPAGDQPDAIEKLVTGLNLNFSEQTLLGVTGSGKTFTMAQVIEKVNRPTLVLAHNKTLAAQLCSEFRDFFPDNAVEYFVSYYDYYQPEAYVASTDTYIEKDSSINDEIDRLRHSATSALFERRDVIIVSSVSCIYSLGNPIDYKSMVISLRRGMPRTGTSCSESWLRSNMRETTSVSSATSSACAGIPWRSTRRRPMNMDPHRVLRGRNRENFRDQPYYRRHAEELVPCRHLPASHYVTPRDKMERALFEIERELWERVKFF